MINHKNIIDELLRSKVIACLVNYDTSEYIDEYSDYGIRICEIAPNLYKVFNFSDESEYVITSSLTYIDLVLYAINVKYDKIFNEQTKCSANIDFNTFKQICKQSKCLYECVETIIKSKEYERFKELVNVHSYECIEFTDKITRIIIKEYMTPNAHRLLKHNWQIIPKI